MVAPSESSRLTLLLRWIGPVRYVPAGTMTLPPPEREHRSIALRKARVESVPGLALRGKVRFGKRGGLMRSRSEGSVRQGSSAAKTRYGAAVRAAVLSERYFMNSRRVVIFRTMFHTKAQRLHKGTSSRHAAALCVFV